MCLWMKDKFGLGLQYLREINSYARENASVEDTENVIKTIEKIREYMRSREDVR